MMEQLLKMDMPNVPYITLSNNVELPSLTVVPLLSLNITQKSEVFRSVINAGYTHIDLSNIGIGTSLLANDILDEFRRLNIQRENIFLTIKMVADGNLKQMKQKITIIMNVFRTDYVNLLMLGFADCDTKHRQEKKVINNNILSKGLMADDHLEQGSAATLINPTDTLIDAWNIAELLYKEGKVKALGVSRTDIALVRQLCERAQIGPHCWQIDLAPLLANFEEVLTLRRHQKVVPIVRANALGASSKLGSQQQRGFYHTLLREMANKYGKSATQVLCRWLYQHGMAVVCSCSTSTRIGAQTNIFDYRISAEDMLRLDGLYNINITTTPRPYQLPQKTSTSERTRHLMYACRHSAELASAFALLGIVFMVLAMEFCFAKWSKLAELMKWAGAATTAALVLTTLRYHVLRTKYRMHINSISRWRSALHLRKQMEVLLEVVVCAIVPLPILHFPSGGDAFACALMFLRLYWLPRVMHLRSRLSTDAAAKSIAGLNRVKTDTRFLLKRMLFLHPGPTLSMSVLCFWLIGAYILRLCESNIDEDKLPTYYNTLWMVCVTFLTIGYGDIYPVTTCGRIMAIVTGIIGVCVASMIVAVIVQKISLSQSEERVHKFMAKTKFSKNLKITAARVLTESWFVYKNRQNPEKLKFHQRRQSAAICALRKLRKEQRMFQEDDCASVDDVAKTISNLVELIRAQGLVQQSANDRLHSLEQQLNGIQEGIIGLSELLSKSLVEPK